MTLTMNGHPFVDGDRVKFATESIKFTCDLDSDASITGSGMFFSNTFIF